MLCFRNLHEDLGKLQCSLSEGKLNRSTNSSARNFVTCFPRLSARYPQTQQRVPPRTRLFSKYFVNQFSLQNKFLFWQATFQKPREGKLVKQTTSFKKKKKTKKLPSTKPNSSKWHVTWGKKKYQIKTVPSTLSMLKYFYNQKKLHPRKKESQVTKQTTPKLGKGRINVACATIIQSPCIYAESSP